MIAAYTLTKANRLKLARAFYFSPRVDLSIDCVIEGQMGTVYTDDPDNPTVFLIEQGGFFCYFAGDSRSINGIELIASLTPPKLLMPSVPGWLELAQKIIGGKLIETSRCSYSFDHLSVEHMNALINYSSFQEEVERIDAKIAAQSLEDQDYFMDISAFDSAMDFDERGIGYCMLKNGKMVGAAYSSLVCSKGIEVSIYVSPEYRRQGVATALGGLLVKYCLENGLEPHWDAANLESYMLAEKMRYYLSGTYSAFYQKE